jgi:hypothetical protein
MTATLTPRLGFLWCNVKWGGPNDHRTEVCSYCRKPMGDDFPLILSSGSGHAAEFCEACQREWFGVEASS